MDPVSALGVAATTFQFAEVAGKALFTTIRLIKDLRDVPIRLRSLLDDVEKATQRIGYLHQALQDSTSRIVTTLPELQIDLLRSLVDDGRAATADLHQKLDRVVGPQAQAGPRLKRAWRAAVSVKLEDEIERDLKRIQRVNDDLTRQLQIATLELQVDVVPSVEALRAELEQLRLDFETASSQMTTMTSTSVAPSSLSLGNSSAEPHNNTTQTILVREQDIFRLNTIPALSGLSEAETAELSRHVAQALVLHVDASKQTSRASASARTATTSSTLSTAWVGPDELCTCKRRRKRTSQKYGFVFLHCESSSMHWRSCPLASADKKLSHYAISLNMAPFVQRTMVVGLDSTVQGASVSIAPSIKFFSTVKRSESEIFKLFDSFPDHCAEEHFQKHETFFQFLWDIEAVRTKLQRLTRSLLKIATEGSGALNDRDEMGNTLLHEIVRLIIMLGSEYAQVSDEIRTLVHLANRTAIDFGASGTDAPDSKACVARLHLQINPRNATALNLAVLLPFWDPYDFRGFPLFEYFQDYDFDETEITIPFSRDSASVRWQFMRYYNDYPELLANLGPLFGAISRRSMSELSRLLESRTCIQNDMNTAPICPLESTMIWWPPGFHVLLSAGIGNSVKALETALLCSNSMAVQALLRSGTGLYQIEVLRAAAGSSDNCQTLVVEELKKRRDGLLDLALQWLTRAELQELGYEVGNTLDSRAFAVYSGLCSRGIPVPERLNPGTIPLFFSFMDTRSWYPFGTGSFFEKLLASGFTEFDVGSPEGCHVTPLLRHAQHFMRVHPHFDGLGQRLSYELLLFVKNGASCVFIGENVWPNLLFYLLYPFAGFWFTEGENLAQHKANLGRLTDLLRHTASRCDSTQTDSCRCFCSPDGCLPLKLIDCCRNNDWQCFYNLSKQDRKGLDQVLLAILEACGLDRPRRVVYIERAVRLETFERLGMAHTCCLWTVDTDLAIRMPFQALEVQELQDEDAELKEQLDLIMEAFGQFQSTFPDSEAELLTQWWEKLNVVLPEPHPYDRCLRCPVEVRRGEVWEREPETPEASWHESGYAGVDFIDAIRLHFQQYLTGAS